MPDNTIITLTLPPTERLDGQGTLLIQRGNLAHLTQFTYLGVQDIAAAIQNAYLALADVEDNPPIIPETTVPPTPQAKPPAKPSEPLLSVLVGKKTVNILARYLQLAQPDQQEQGLFIAGKLLSSKLWDGKTPIFIPDAVKVAKQLKHLDEKTLALFKLEDFVQCGTDTPPAEIVADADEPLPTEGFAVGQTVELIDGAVDADGDPVPFTVGRVVEVDESETPPRLWLESPAGENDVWVYADQVAAPMYAD
jgi:hypothetical protein